MGRRKTLLDMTLNQLKGKLFSTLMTSFREGLASTRIAEFLNEQLKILDQTNGQPGAVMLLDTGEQCTIAGVGPIFDKFLKTGKLMSYSGFGTEASTFEDKDFETVPLRLINYDETFYKMPYDVCKSLVYDPSKDFLIQKSQPQKGKRKNKKTKDVPVQIADTPEVESSEVDSDDNETEDVLCHDSSTGERFVPQADEPLKIKSVTNSSSKETDKIKRKTGSNATKFVNTGLKVNDLKKDIKKRKRISQLDAAPINIKRRKVLDVTGNVSWNTGNGHKSTSALKLTARTSSETYGNKVKTQRRCDKQYPMHTNTHCQKKLPTKVVSVQDGTGEGDGQDKYVHYAHKGNHSDTNEDRALIMPVTPSSPGYSFACNNSLTDFLLDNSVNEINMNNGVMLTSNYYSEF